MRDQHNKTKLSNKPMAWRIKPKETDIEFNTPEQKRLVTKRLNKLNEWLGRVTKDGNLWGMVVVKQMYDHLEKSSKGKDCS